MDLLLMGFACIMVARNCVFLSLCNFFFWVYLFILVPDRKPWLPLNGDSPSGARFISSSSCSCGLGRSSMHSGARTALEGVGVMLAFASCTSSWGLTLLASWGVPLHHHNWLEMTERTRRIHLFGATSHEGYSTCLFPRACSPSLSVTLSLRGLQYLVSLSATRGTPFDSIIFCGKAMKLVPVL